MKTYILKDIGVIHKIQAKNLNDARSQAKEWALDGTYDNIDSTFWVDIIIENSKGETIDVVSVAINPPEPLCVDGPHDWIAPWNIVGGIKENPGIWGNAGGVVVTECCSKCGCQRTINTWAHNPATGEQGLVSVAYEESVYDLKAG